MTLSAYSPLALSFIAVSAALELLRIYFDIFEMLVMMKVLGMMMVRVTEMVMMLVMMKVSSMLMVKMVMKLMMCRAGSLSPWGGQLKVVRFLCLLGVDGGGELSISA